MTSRAKVLARTNKADRERLCSYTPEQLAQNVIGIGQSMSNDAENFIRQRKVHPDSHGASLTYEAHRLAGDRAMLLAICNEMRARIDLLLSGGDLRDVCGGAPEAKSP